MNEKAEIEIPGDVMRLSPNRRMHWQERVCLMREWKARAWFAWVAAGSPRFDVPVRIQITLRRSRVVDPDNAISSCKALLDGLCHNKWHVERNRLAMLPGDSAEWVEYAPVLQSTGQLWKGREVVIVSVWPRSGTIP